jgi:dihydroorotate dehydrogenase (NAD+) catalytic subunit
MYNYNGLKVSRRLIASTAFDYGTGHIFSENPWMWLFIKLGLSNIEHFGAFVTPTITAIERSGFFRKGRPWEIIKIYPNKVLNKKGWRNCGINKLVEKELPKLGNNIQKAIISVGALEHVLEVPRMLGQLNYLDIAGAEINASCHNVDLTFLADMSAFKSLCREARRVSWHALGVKLSVESDYVTMAKIAQDEGINFLHAINTTRVHSKVLGACGMSSYKNKELALRVIGDLRNSGVEIPIIGGSGIWTMRDIQDYKNAGANLFSVSHQFLYFPPWLSVLARRVG